MSTPWKRANSEEKKIEKEDSIENEFLIDEDDYVIFIHTDPKYYYEKGRLAAELV